MIVDSIMTRRVVTAPADATVRDVARILRSEHISCVVITSGGLPVGIVTERDLAHRVLAEGRDPERTRAADIMSSPIATVEPAAQVRDAIEKMRAHRIKRLVVVLGKDVRGIVTVTDIAYARPELTRRFMDGWVKARWVD